MNAEREAAANAGLLFLSSFYNVNCVMFKRECEDFELPSEYVSARESEIVGQMLRQTQNRPTACFISSRALIHFCLMIAEDMALLVGPFRDKIPSHAELPGYLTVSAEQCKAYLSHYKALPSITNEQIKLAARTMFISLYGREVYSSEQTIDLQEYLRGEKPQFDFDEEQDAVREPNNDDLLFQYMAHVRAGNFERALAAHRKMMQGRVPQFSLINVVEGTSRLRAVTAVALHNARVSDLAANAVLNDYKLKIRSTTNLTEMTRWNERMIEQACALVRSLWSGSFSQPISLAVDYIHRNLARPLTVSEIATEVGFSPNSFSTKFHQEVGVSATSYITTLRMKQAAQLLVYTNLDIKDICTNIGMLDGNYFSRCFKKEYGYSPSKFRERGILPE